MQGLHALCHVAAVDAGKQPHEHLVGVGVRELGSGIRARGGGRAGVMSSGTSTWSSVPHPFMASCRRYATNAGLLGSGLRSGLKAGVPIVGVVARACLAACLSIAIVSMAIVSISRAMVGVANAC